MTKQKEIREGVKKVITFAEVEGQTMGKYPDLTQLILSYLHSQGVVIKVDRELPHMDDTDWTWKVNAGDYHITDLKKGAAQQIKIMLRAGYVAVESLVKDGS